MFSVRFLDRILDELFTPEYEVPSDKELAYEIALPGVAKSHLKLRVDKDRLGYSILASGKDHKDREFSKRILFIPEKYDVENTKARLSDGLLTLQIPLKSQKATLEGKEIKLLEGG